ncbi:MAG: VWA domain-containing protein [Planctomycetaceae bacterium]
MNQRTASFSKRHRGGADTRRLAGSAIVSGTVHAAAVVLCALWLVPFPTAPAPVAIRTVWDEGAKEIALDPVPLTVLADIEDSGGSSFGSAMFEHLQRSSLADAAIEISDLAPLDVQEVEAFDPAAFTEMVSLAGGAGSGMQGLAGGGDGTGTALGSGEGGSAFFGQRVEGKRVVYVVDASRSMNHPHPGPMLTRFGRVKLELIRSISRMTAEQQFFIVYFNDRALPMPSDGMALATPGSQEKYLRWAAQMRADGFTNPEQALGLALQLRPDVVYFLTDGNFPAKIVKEVTQANRNRVVIHTIGFADDEGEDLLKKIAAQNWGQYQFIPADEVNP